MSIAVATDNFCENFLVLAKDELPSGCVQPDAWLSNDTDNEKWSTFLSNLNEKDANSAEFNDSYIYLRNFAFRYAYVLFRNFFPDVDARVYAEDATAEVMLKIWSCKEQLSNYTLGTFSVVVRNKVFQILREEKVKRKHVKDQFDAQFSLRHAIDVSIESRPDKSAICDDLIETYQRAKSSLKKDELLVLEMLEKYGYGGGVLQKIVDSHGIPRTTAWKRYASARKKIIEISNGDITLPYSTTLGKEANMRESKMQEADDISKHE